jgi:FPC/CPF motif-containing protein YcgG
VAEVLAEGSGITYVLPIRTDVPVVAGELTEYLRWLSGRAEVIVVDGSPPAVFAEHEAAWGGFTLHIPPDPDLRTPMGKVGGVLTGVRYARHEHLILADDDVRWDEAGLARAAELLDDLHVVRPQNYFDPLPWHARWDSGRMLLNRMTGGDWPGTLAVRRSALRATGGYRGDVMFENLELVRTVLAAGGREGVPLDLYVRRRPCTAHHFWSQRVRQAYDEWARPMRLAIWLTVLPLALAFILTAKWTALGGGALFVAVLAEAGRWRAGAARFFPLSCSLLAPVWVAERAVCAWLAMGSRLIRKGVRYRDCVLAEAATPLKELRRRHAGALTDFREPPAPSVAPDLFDGFDGPLARAHSAYAAPRAGRLMRVDDPERPLPAVAELVHDSFLALTLSSRFPCGGAKAALKRGAYRMGFYGEMAAEGSTAGLARDLSFFLREQESLGDVYTTFVATFDGPVPAGETEFEELLWRQLQALHDLDAPHHAWDPAVSDDPEDPRFSFSFAGRGFYVIGLHAASSRWARRFAWPTLVFNAHDQFETLRADGRYRPLQASVRARDRELQGNINPTLHDFGESSEARQYSGRAVGEGWRCPFHVHHVKESAKESNG